MADRIKPTEPSRFSPDWWTMRKSVMSEIAADQARLRKAHPSPEDRDPVLQQLLQQQSDAALAIALYGDDPKWEFRELSDAWDDAARRVGSHRASVSAA